VIIRDKNGQSWKFLGDAPGDWRSLAERATNETDPKEMLAIITELNRALEREQTVHQQQRLGHQDNV
jgi:hypothetical protein